MSNKGLVFSKWFSEVSRLTNEPIDIDFTSWNEGEINGSPQYFCIAVLFNPQKDKVLLVKDKEAGKWKFPGGAIDAGESPEIAIKREIQEETELIVDRIFLVSQRILLPFAFTGQHWLYAYIFTSIVTEDIMRKEKNIFVSCDLLEEYISPVFSCEASREILESSRKTINVALCDNFINKIDNRLCWNMVSSDFLNKNEISTEDFHYGPLLPGDSVLKIVPDCKDKSVLDLGCGSGENSIYLAKSGAIVTAIDISEEQINAARIRAEKNNVHVNFIISDLETWVIDSVGEPYDLIFSVYALQFVHDIERIVGMLSKYHINNGLWVLSLPHPIHVAGHWVGNKDKEFVINNYYDNNQIVKDWITDNGKVKYKIYNHQIEKLMKAFQNNGYVATSIFEPLPVSENIATSPFTSQKTGYYESKRENMQRVPSTLVMVFRHQ